MAISYYLIIEDFGRGGLEGITHPEMTRRAVVDALRDGNWPNLWAIHFVDMDTRSVEDVTDELKAEAGVSDDYTTRLTPSDRLAWLHDRARDERKHGAH